MRRYGSTDTHLLSAVAVGQITADPATGHVAYKGKPVGRVYPDGRVLIDVPRTDRPGTVTIAAHRIVWTCCVAPIPDGMTIRHRNGHRWDNRLSNLELATPSRRRG